jgi:hypothetical protein
MACERGQSTVEWVALVLLVALAVGALLAFGPHVDGRGYGGFLARRILCAIRGGCGDGRDALRLAYGERDAALVREYAPNIVAERFAARLALPYLVDVNGDLARVCEIRGTPTLFVVERGTYNVIDYSPEGNAAWVLERINTHQQLAVSLKA